MESIVTIEATKQEAEEGRWGVENLRKIVEAMHNDGVLVLNGLIHEEHMDEMNKFMVEDGLRIRREATYLNFGTENVQQSPPLHLKDLLYSDVFSNALLFDAVKYILGPDPKWDFVSGNTAMPNSTGKQPVHSDERCTYMNSTFYLIANIPLIDTSPETGSTQLWPGTHSLRDDKYFHNHAEAIREALDEQKKFKYPVQPTMKRGSILLRDLTLWHCGMPNPSDKVRCMMALGFSAKWWKNECYIKVPNAELQKKLTQTPKAHGINVKTKIVDNYESEKDKHDFNLGETNQTMYDRLPIPPS